MTSSVKQNLLATLGLIVKRPIVLLPFTIFAFFELLTLELFYFSSGWPLSLVIGPVVRKFYGERFVHYPGNLFVLPQIFYYAQIFLYIVVGVFLTAIAVNVFRNIQKNLPLKPDALIKNSLKRYPAFLLYGIVIVACWVLMRKADVFILSRFFAFAVKSYPNAVPRLGPFITPVFIFFTNVVLHAFFVLTVPIIVIQQRSFLRALGSSIRLGGRYFFVLFTLVFLPYVVYLPLSLVKSFSARIAVLTFPEMNAVITAAGVILALFVDCVVVLSASRFLLERESLKR